MESPDHVADPQSNGSETHDLTSLLSSSERDFLIRNNGDQVQIDNLKGKKVGIYFSASWCGPCLHFTPSLIEVYDELLPKNDFEVVFVSRDRNDESFKGYFSKMPWLAIPISDSASREHLRKLFKVAEIPSLVILEKNGKVLTKDGVDFIQEYGVEAYPFTSEKIKELKDQAATARREQSLKSLLVSSSRDFVISVDDKKVPISELEGKTVGLYFTNPKYPYCAEFTPKLVKVYEEVKGKGENFELVTIPLWEDEECFKQKLESMPWLSLPFKDKSSVKLDRYFDVSDIPTLVIIGPDGKTLQPDVVETIEEHGSLAYPFTPEKYVELEAIEKAKREARTLESILVSGDPDHVADPQSNGSETHDLKSLLSSSERDFLIRNNGDQVQIENLKGKKVGLYFSASWCGPSRQFTPSLIKVYNELLPKNDFEVVFVSRDPDDESFKDYFSKMPWLAIPISDSGSRGHLRKLFKYVLTPSLVILEENGKVSTEDGVDFIQEYGVDAYPFTSEKIKELKDQEAAARREQSLKSLLVSRSRDFVISADDKKVPISELEGKTVGLYFTNPKYQYFAEFTPKLVKVYEEVKGKGENFELVTIPLWEDEECFKQKLESMPWLSLPFKDKSSVKLARYFGLSGKNLALVIIGPDGKTLQPDVVGTIKVHGPLAYPFTPEKLVELEAIKKAKREAQTLEFILVSGDLDFVIGQDEIKVPVTDLVGKTILLSFSAHFLSGKPGFDILPKLVEVYNQIKAKDEQFEVIFISSDRDEASFKDYFSRMPWLALPFGDKRGAYLKRIFEIRGIPALVALGPSGRTITTNARRLIQVHSANAYPFTEERLEEIEAEYREMAKGWPEKVKHSTHEHELVLTRCQEYRCDGCEYGEGRIWSYKCAGCNFDLHTKCALNEDVDNNTATEKDVEEEKAAQQGWVCDGDVCHKA